MTPDEQRVRFHDLGRQRDAILAQSSPLREKRDKISNDARAKEEKLNAEIREVEAGLHDIDTERSQIARGLNNETGEPT